LETERIKQRDRWACKFCGQRFIDLDVIGFGSSGNRQYITLCKECLEGLFKMPIKEGTEKCEAAVLENKVVLVGDCHGHFDKLDQILTAEEPFNFFVSVGDVADLNDMALVRNIEVIDKWGGKGYFVRGNHDMVTCFEPLTLHQEINGLTIASLNGIIRSRNFLKDTPNNVSFREILYLSHLTSVDILVTHQPPTGLHKNMGEPVLEELLNYLVPRIYISGHVHKYKLKFHLNTFVISLPMLTKGYAVAYFQGKDLRNIEIILKKGKKFIRV
jgi:Icc-related predicted phosphoesterase